MPYATQSDIVTLYGDAALVVADRDGDGLPDAAAVARALASASEEIDLYVGARYRLPLPAGVPMLMQWCVDIALYRLAQTADVLSDEIRRRYDDALAALQRVAKGGAALSLPVDPEGDTTDPGPRPVVTGGPPRLFSRDAMRGL